jgi:hypothetical protein
MAPLRLILPKRHIIRTAPGRVAARRRLPDIRFPYIWIPKIIPSRAAVAFDANITGTATDFASSSPWNYNGLTVGAALSNGALLAVVAVDGNIAISTVAWDPAVTNQALTIVGSVVSLNGVAANGNISLWQRINPTSGNKTLRVTTASATTGSVYAMSFTGVNQTGGTTSFANFNSASGNGGSPNSLAVTTATGDIAVVAFSCNGTINSVGATQIFRDTVATGNDVAADQGTSSTSYTGSQATTGGANWAIVGVDIVAAGAGDTLFAQACM